MNKVVTVLREHGTVKTFLCRNLSTLARCIHLADILFERRTLIAGKIEVLAGSILSVIPSHFETATSELLLQLTRLSIIKINVTETIALA